MGSHAHHRHASTAVACAVVTVSDTRTPESDLSGTLAFRNGGPGLAAVVRFPLDETRRR